ncbi:nuclear transport factor 2 family protein [Kineococcus sp. SYSU DK002]|uniref:nuclear transport factor 2 family protein n=1 Tax=Kineococcus sp. SYSU DK002 TaxID=3383123 RepID=UPI003D7EF606
MDIVEISQLVLRERLSRDRGRWAQMGEAFHPGARVKVSWIDGTAEEFVAASERMNGQGDVATHRCAPPVVTLHGDRALVEMPAAVEMTGTLDGEEVHVVTDMQILYRVLRYPDGWAIDRLDCIYERDTMSATATGLRTSVDLGTRQSFRAPYRNLAYYLSRKGYQISDELFGIDRPDQVQQLFDAATAWVHAAPPAPAVPTHTTER